MGITIPSPVLWTGSVYFGINANVNTQVSLTGRGSSQSTTQSGGAVCQGCVNVNTLTVSSGSHSLENSKIGTTSISGSFGIIRACTISELSISGSVSRICSSSISNTSISGSMSKIVGLGTSNLSLSSSSCDIAGSSTSELSCSDTNLIAHKISATSCSVDGTSLAKIHNSSLDTLSISSSQAFLSNISCKTLSVGSKSSVDIKDGVALAITNAGFLTIACGTTLALQNSGVVWGSLSNLGAISNSTVLFAYQSMCMGLGNSGVVKAWNTAGGILTWTADGEGAVGNSTFDDFGWLPSDPPPGGGSGTGGGGGSGGGGGGGTGGGTSYGGGPVTQEDLANLNTAICGQISTLQNSVNSQVADLNGGIAASRLEYIAGLGVVREDMVTGLDGLEHSLTSGIDVVQQDLVNGLAEVGSTIQQVDTDFRTRVADARVEYISPRQIGLTTQTFGLVGAVWVNSELIIADDSVNVFNTCPVLDWNYRTSEIVSSYLQPSTEYYIYLANHESPEFNIGALAVSDEYPSTYEWDFRGRLFLSTTPDIDGFFSNFGAGLNARIVGSLKTDSSPYNTYNDRYPTPDCGPFFLQEVDISWIAKKTSYPETYREYSDFTLFYKDQNTLELKLVDGLYGQIFVGGNLHIFENNQQITRTSFRIIWNETNINIESKIIELDETEILPLTEYFIYVTNDLDIWNFNEINPNTQRPWQEFDSYAQLFYDSEYDLRKSLILSTKEPEYGVMSQQWPGYCSRYIGSVSTDNYKYFIYKSTISAIRSLQLNPTYFDGLAEISLQDVSTTTFKVIRKRGTSGIVMVGGKGVLTYASDNPSVHTVTTSDTIYSYNEAIPASPLTSTGTILNIYVGIPVYLYLANDRPCWGSLANRTFLCNEEPTDAYLSQSYPGNNARWVATIVPQQGNVGNNIADNSEFDTADNWENLAEPSAVYGGIGSENTFTDYATPIMTNNNSPSPAVASASSYATAPYVYPPYKAFNQTCVNNFDSWVATANVNTSPQSIMISFGSLVVINKYNLKSRSIAGGDVATRWPSGWQLQGTNNAAATASDAETANGWTTLDTRSSVADPGAGQWLSSFITFTSYSQYSKYRIRITASSDTSYVGLADIKLVADTRVAFMSLDNPWEWSTEHATAKHFAENSIDVITGESTDSEIWTGINDVILTQSTSGDITESIIYHVVSFDNEVTWKVFKSAAWIDVVRNNAGTWQYSNAGTWTNASSNTRAQALIQATNQAAYQWTKTNIDAMTGTNWESEGGWSVDITTIDWDYRGINGSNYNTTTETSQLSSNGTTAAADSELDPTYAAWKVFDRATAAHTNAWVSTNTAHPHWVRYDFGSGNEKTIIRYRFCTRNEAANNKPKTFKLQGSNTNTTDSASIVWTDLNTQTNIAEVAQGAWSSYFSFSNTTAYRHYRFYISDSYLNTGNYAMLGELQLFTSTTVTPTFTKATFKTRNSQPIIADTSESISSGSVYRVDVTVNELTSGSITPVIGGTEGTPISTIGRSSQFFIATDASPLSLTPSEDAVCIVKSAYISKVNSAEFSGGYVLESIANKNIEINDNKISKDNTWSSQKIQLMYDTLQIQISAASLFTSQQASGLNLVLSYVNTNTIRLTPTTGVEVSVALPDGTIKLVGVNGITKTVTGNNNTLYYIYLGITGLAFYTTPPDTNYANLSTLDNAFILVGTMYVSPVNTLGGSWRVCSSHNCPTESWDTHLLGKTQPVPLDQTKLILTAGTTYTVTGKGTLTAVWETVSLHISRYCYGFPVMGYHIFLATTGNSIGKTGTLTSYSPTIGINTLPTYSLASSCDSGIILTSWDVSLAYLIVTRSRR